MVALGDIFEIARGGSPRPIDAFITDDSDGVNWISIRDASNSSKYITKTEKKILPSGVSKSRLVKPGDFLLTNSMSFGRPYILQTSGCIHDGWLVLSGDQKIIDQDYFYHLLGSDLIYRKFVSIAAGAVVKNLNSDLVRNVMVPLPPLAEQRRIAAILDKADALRAKRREAIAKLDQLLQSVFLEMFGGSTGATTSVAELASSAGAIRTGPFGSQLLHSELVDRGIAVLGIDNAVSNTFAWAKPRFITAEKYSQLSRYRVNPGDVLITIMGTCGRCAVVPDDVPAAINTKHLCCISLDRTRCEPEFLHSYFLMHPIAQRYLKSRAKGAIMAGLNMGIIKELPVALPSFEDQRRFVTIKKSLERQRAQAVSQENRSNQLFTALQQDAFAGAL